MKEDKTYWEELISFLYNKEGNIEIGDEQKSKKDLEWADDINTKLKKVFVWDQFNKSEAKYKLQRKIEVEKKISLNQINTIWKRAAVILIALMAGVFVHYLYVGNNQQRFTEIKVPPGQMTQIELSDGTKIWLNSGSTFRYPNEFENRSREVFLNGEAFMQVAKNKRKPFHVHTQKFAIEVLGTSFNVNAYDDDKEACVALVEGLVKLHSANNEWEKRIVPGQVAKVEMDKLIAIDKADTEFYTSWTKGEIAFRKEKLQDITRKLERWYNIEFEFADEELKNLQFSGTFLKYKPIEQVLTSFKIMDDRFDFIMKERINQKSIIQIKKRE